MRDDCQFRSATPQDAEAVVDLVNGSYSGPDRDLGWTPETGIFDIPRTSLAEICNSIAAEGSSIILCETADGLVGCCQIERSGDAAYFGLFAVRPGLQAGGLGGEIMAQAEARVVQLWASTSVWMTVVSLQTKLIAYYERRGYCRTGARMNFPEAEMASALRQDFDLVVLRKALR